MPKFQISHVYDIPIGVFDKRTSARAVDVTSTATIEAVDVTDACAILVSSLKNEGKTNIHILSVSLEGERVGNFGYEPSSEERKQNEDKIPF